MGDALTIDRGWPVRPASPCSQVAVLLCALDGVAPAADAAGPGTVVGWGDNTNGLLSVPAGLTGVTAINRRQLP